MDRSEWLDQARGNSDLLEDLLRAYHPGMRGEKRELPITARGPEAMSARVRSVIAREWEGHDPIAMFRSAMANQNVGQITTLLNEAWFGVPESTDCWSVPGFREAVRLLEDLPE